MKGKTKYGILALFIVGIVVTAGVASAFGGQMFGKDSETRGEIEAALDSGDYDAWIEAHNKAFTQEMFEEAQERHQEREQYRESRDAVRDAIEAEDYEAYTYAVEGLDEKGRFAVMDEQDFETLVELHKAREAGDFDTMKELRDELDMEGFGNELGMMNGECLGNGQGMGRGQGQGMHQGNGQGMKGSWN